MGFGRIGREVAKRCAAFGMTVTIYDPYVQANIIEQSGDYRSIPDFEAVLPETDILTVHMPLGAESREPDRRQRAFPTSRRTPSSSTPPAAASSTSRPSTTP